MAHNPDSTSFSTPNSGAIPPSSAPATISRQGVLELLEYTWIPSNTSAPDLRREFGAFRSLVLRVDNAETKEQTPQFKLKPPGRLNLSWNDCLESITIQITGCHAHWLPTFVRSLNYSVLHTIVIVADNKRANQALLGTKYFAELDRWYGETMARDDTLRGLRKLQVRCNFVLKTSRAVEEGRKLWFATARSACQYGIFELVEYGPPASNANPEMEICGSGQ